MSSEPQTSTTTENLSRVPRPTIPTQVYGPDDDVCSFGAECNLTAECVSSSPALDKLLSKYVFPMREGNTQVFFDHSNGTANTLMIVFAPDRHGMVLDIVSVLKALSVRVHRIASSESETLRLIMARMEGEIVSKMQFGVNMRNCVAFWISDEETGDRIYDDGIRLDQIASCIKVELNTPYPRPKPALEDRWHRIGIQKNRADRYTVFSIQTPDRPRLLAALTEAFDKQLIDVASANIQTFTSRVENTFYVTKRGFKQPLEERDIDAALMSVLRALWNVGERNLDEMLWYQVRDGAAMKIAEAIFIDEVNNRELACFRFSEIETPNFRGRLPDVPYLPLLSS